MNKAMITFSFDDGFRETYLNTKDLARATYNIIPGFVGNKFHNFDIMTWSDLIKAKKLRNEIASHSISHPKLVDSFINNVMRFNKSILKTKKKVIYVKKAFRELFNHKPEKVNFDLIKELKDSKEILDKKLKQDTKSFVYPKGIYNNKIKNLVKKFYGSARTMDRGFNKKFDRFALKIQSWDKDTTLKEANKWVDTALRKKSWLIEVYHLIAEDSKGYYYFTPLNEFKKHLDYIKSRDIEIKTQDEVIGKLR